MTSHIIAVLHNVILNCGASLMLIHGSVLNSRPKAIVSISASALVCLSHSAVKLKLMLKLSYIILESEFTDVEQPITVAVACDAATPSYVSREVHRLWCRFDEEALDCGVHSGCIYVKLKPLYGRNQQLYSVSQRASCYSHSLRIWIH